MTQTFTITVEPAPINDDNVGLITELGVVILCGAAVIYMAKQLLHIFKVNSDGS